MDDLSSAIRKNMEHKESSTVNDRLELLLAALVAMAIYQRDTVVGRFLVPTMMMTYSVRAFTDEVSCYQSLLSCR